MTELPATFGKYFLTEKLATGGMAEIYLGKLLGPGGFEKQLVIKQIHPRLAAEPHFIELFVAEAKTLVGLTHGNIVPVYELGIVDDTYFIAMEYIDGPTLWTFTEAVWAAGEPISPPVAAWIAAEILDGLDYAHRKGEGVIHRDLSPRNVMLSRDGQVLLVDFGIAVPFGAGDDPGAEGAPTGSFPYMSPEQVQRHRLTTASDLFSASVLLWEMLAGRRLFARADADATLDAVLHAPIPPPSSVRKEVPAKLDEVVLRGLERDPAKRWPSAGDFLGALNRYLYALEAAPAARELTALIARHCPPVPAGDVGDVASTSIDPRKARGPGTEVVPRRPPTVREKSFATHIEIEKVFGATPLFPLKAIRDDEAPATSEPGTRPHIRPAPPVAGERALPWLPVVAMVTAALAVVAVIVWLAIRPTSAAATAADAAAIAAIAPDAAAARVEDAAPVADAAPAPDAARRPPRDAGVRPPRVDAAVPSGTGTIKIGARPWGEVYIDGKKQAKTAPNSFRAGAGPHEVVVVFPGEDGERRKSFQVVVRADETESIFADFEN
jgi:serine/threonine protein kinase